MKTFEEIRIELEKGILLSPTSKLLGQQNGERASFYITEDKGGLGFGYIKQIPNYWNGNIIDGYEVEFLDTPQPQTHIVLKEDMGDIRPPDEGLAGANFLTDPNAKRAINFVIKKGLENSATLVPSAA